jgi:uncharacterized protein
VFASFPFTDAASISAALIAVVILGLAKGGLGGVGMLVVPVMALVISPVQAAAIVLPLLIVSDIISLWTWRGAWDRRTLALMLPGAMIGIGIGWLTAAMVSDDVVRLIVGGIALAFVLRWLTQTAAQRAAAQPQHAGKASFWGGVAGYTSFVAHAGGPPYQVYTMPLGMDARTYTGTNVAFFAIVNVVKLVPYFALGQFDRANLTTSAVFAPVAVAATLAGAAIIRRMSTETFYRITYALAFLVGLKLVWDGASHLLTGQ